MSVRFTATWYDVMQARQPAVTAICRPAGWPGRYSKESWRASTGGLKVQVGVCGGGGCVAHTPHTAHTSVQYSSYSWDSRYAGVKMAEQCVVICSS